MVTAALLSDSRGRKRTAHCKNTPKETITTYQTHALGTKASIHTVIATFKLMLSWVGTQQLAEGMVVCVRKNLDEIDVCMSLHSCFSFWRTKKLSGVFMKQKHGE